MMLTSGFVGLVASGGALAANGDQLIVSGVSIAPGNPCGITGLPGGVAVKQAGAASRLFYATNSTKNISMANALVTSTYAPACSALVPGVPGASGWGQLAYDATRNLLWGARADHSGTVVGMTMAGTVVATFSGPVSDPQGITIDEASPGAHDMLIAWGAQSVPRYTVSPATAGAASYTVTRQAQDLVLPDRAYHLAAWQGALLASDSSWGGTVRNYNMNGVPLGLSFAPGYDWVDPWFQHQRSALGVYAMAFDAQTYAPKGALWTYDIQGYSICVENCHVYGPCPMEGGVCIGPAPCIANCNLTERYETTYFPYLRAFEVVRKCPDGSTPAPAASCPCPSVPAPTFLAPDSKVYIRGVATTTPANPPLAVQGTLTATAQGRAIDRVTMWGAPGTTSSPYAGAPADIVFDTAQLPRGGYTVNAQSFDTQSNCLGPVAQKALFLEDPTLRTFAQALHVEGNVPLHVVAGTIAVRPADDLLGQESAVVADPHQAGDVQFDADLLLADAAHGPVPGAEQHLVADAAARFAHVDADVQLDQLCYDLTAQAACLALPRVTLREDVMGSDAHAQMDLVSAAGSASSTTDMDRGAEAVTSSATAPGFSTHGVTPCPFTAQAVVQPPASLAPIGVGPVSPGVPCTISAGGITATFNDVGQRNGALFHEAWATVLHVTIQEGPYRGEILLGTSYAGISLGGASLLQGPPGSFRGEDDFGTGGDVAGARNSGPVLAEGAYSGSFEGSDRADAFQALVTQGHKLKVALLPAHRLSLALDPLPTLPAAGLAPRFVHMDLYDPAGVLRDSTVLAAPAEQAEVELNVDVDGLWSVVLTRTDHLLETAPYTLLVAEPAISFALTDQPDIALGCASPYALAPTGQTQAAITPGDVGDSYLVHLASPGTMAITLSVPDLDGADLDLELRDAATCGGNVFQQSLNGKNFAQPKGTPDSIVQQNLPAGDYVVSVLHANGLDDYDLQVTMAKPA
ncbi:MAG: hypothetical protein LC624_00420 [Halobacteriales archaeon]|nr:hypothetical protein [Halobacteriales archaeon]